VKQIHATCIAIDGKGVLLRGPSGVGKSDLALRLIDGGGDLVADDRVDLDAAGGQLIASAPDNLKGFLEVRGLGIMRQEAYAETPVMLVVDLVAAGDVERMPEPEHTELQGIEIRLIRLDPLQISTPAKIRMALRQLV